MSTSVLITIISAALVALVVIPVLIRVSHRYSILDQPGYHKRHKEPVPFLGGLGLFAAVWTGVVLIGALFPGTYGQLRDALVPVFLGALIITLVGLVDDLSPLSARFKLGAQIIVGLILYLAGPVSYTHLTLPTN